MKKTGYDWAIALNLPIVNPNGWLSINEFNTVKIRQEEFLERASNSELGLANINMSRRDAQKLLQKIKKLK